MMTVVGVRFKAAGKVYYFDPQEFELQLHDLVVVETARGTECGEIVMERREVEDEEIAPPLKQVLRPVTEKDRRILAENKEKEAKAFEVCKKKIAEHNLNMKLVQAEITFDRSKILFYFTADGPDRHPRRSEAVRRTRCMRQTALLQHVFERFPACFGQDGKGAKPFAFPDEDQRHLRTTDVLPQI